MKDENRKEKMEKGQSIPFAPVTRNLKPATYNLQPAT